MTETTDTAATRWRKKPVVVEAVQWTGDNLDAVYELTGCENFDVLNGQDRANCDDPEATATVFDKLHSTWVLVFDGQWIIKGVKSEFYPCADDVFRETYEPACLVCDGSGKLTVPDPGGESASEQDCPDPVHDQYPEDEDETPGYWQVRAALSTATGALQHVRLGTDDGLAAMAREALAKVDAIMEGPRDSERIMGAGTEHIAAELAEVHRLDWPEDR
jgi:hypothetical protein